MAEEKIPFDYLGARKAGYSDLEIKNYLNKNYSFDFDIEGAKKSGYSDKEIADYIYSAPSQLKKKELVSVSAKGTATPALFSESLKGAFQGGGIVGESDVQSTLGEIKPPKVDLGFAKDYNKKFEDFTGHREVELGSELPQIKKQREANKYFRNRSIEENEIKPFQASVSTGTLSPKKLEKLYNQPYGKKIVTEEIEREVPGGSALLAQAAQNPKALEDLSLQINTKNRGEAVARENEYYQNLNNDLQKSFTDLKAKVSWQGSQFGGGGSATVELPKTDIENPQQLTKLLEYIGGVDYLQDAQGNRVDKKELTKKINQKLFYLGSQKGVDAEVQSLTPQIAKAVTRVRTESEKGEAEATPQYDEAATEHFKLGLSFLKDTKPAIYNNIVRGIKEKGEIADTDFEDLASLGQDYYNQRVFIGGASDPSLLGKETDIKYTSLQTKKAQYAKALSEKIAAMGYKNNWKIPQQVIYKAAENLGLQNKDIVQDIAANEAAGGYGIAKGGALRSLMRGMAMPIKGIQSTINAVIESPAETYLNSKKFDKGDQLIANAKGQYSEELPSEQGNLWYDMAEGFGQIIPQILIAKGIGAAIEAPALAAGQPALTAAQRSAVAAYPGTFISTFAQSYGDAYKDALQKTGSVSKAKLMGTINGISSAAAELFLPDVKIADYTKGLLKGAQNNLAKNIVRVIDAGGGKEAAKSAVKQFAKDLVQVGIRSGSVAAKETAEELATNVANWITESVFSPSTIKDRDLANELFDTAKATSISMVIPAILGGAGDFAQNKKITRQGLNYIAINSEEYKPLLDKQLADGILSQADYDLTMGIINSHKQNIKDAPRVDANGELISGERQLEYAYQGTVASVNEQKAEATNDPVQKKFFQDKAKKANDIKEKILYGEPVVEGMPKQDVAETITVEEEPEAPLPAEEKITEEVKTPVGEEVVKEVGEVVPEPLKDVESTAKALEERRLKKGEYEIFQARLGENGETIYEYSQAIKPTDVKEFDGYFYSETPSGDISITDKSNGFKLVEGSNKKEALQKFQDLINQKGGLENLKAQSQEILKNRELKFAEDYQKAKADGSNPELVKSIEDLLGGEVKEEPSLPLTEELKTNENVWGTNKGLQDNFYTKDVNGLATKIPLGKVEKIEIDDYEFYVSKVDGDWKVIEPKSGLEISTGKLQNNKKSAIEDAEIRLKQNGGSKNLPTLIDRAINGFIERNSKLLKSELPTTEEIKTQQYAVQEPSATSVLQYPQEGVGEAGGERGGMEQGIKGPEVTKEGKVEGEEREEVTPPVPPKPKKPTEEGEYQPQGKKKALVNRLYTSKNIPEDARIGFEKDGLRYQTKSQKEAELVAKGVIDELGIDEALNLAESFEFDGDVNSLIYAESLNRLAEMERKAKTPAEKEALAKKFAEVGIQYGIKSQYGGRFNAAINYFYEKSPLGIVLMEDAKRKDEFKSFSKGKEQSWKEFYGELMKEPDFESIIKEQVSAELKKERAEARKGRIDAVSKKIDDLATKWAKKLSIDNKDDVQKMGVSGIDIFKAAAETAKASYKAGEAVAKVIQDAIDYVSEKIGTTDWDKDDFRNDLSNILGEKKSALDARKDAIRKQIKKIDEQIENKQREVKEKKEKETDEELEALTKERDEKKKRLEKIAPLRETEEGRNRELESRKKSLKKQLEDLDKQIAEKKRTPKEPKAQITNDEIEDLKEQREEKKKQLEEVAPIKDTEAYKKKVLDRLRKRLQGLSKKDQDEVIRRSFAKIIEAGGLEFDDFKKIIADIAGYGELTADEKAKLQELVGKTNAVEKAAEKVREEKTDESLKKFREAEMEAGKASRELAQIIWNKPDIVKRLVSIMQLSTLGIPALINNPIYNIWNQSTLRFPVGLINDLIDRGIALAAKVTGTPYQREYNTLETQKEFFKKLGFGAKESADQLLTGLNRQDYLQKEVYGQQIQPLQAAKDWWDNFTGKKKITTAQSWDKAIQATVGAPAEIVARFLNVGDKPQRFAAEGAQASAFAKAFGLKGIDYKIFIEFPREEAYAYYKRQGLSDSEAGKKADYVKDVIVREGQRATFQQENLLNTGLSALFNSVFGKGKETGLANLAKATIVSPYIKIPTNAFWSYYNLVNPEIALLQSFVHGGRAYNLNKKGEKEQAKLALRESRYWLAHAVTGVAMKAVIIALVKAGVYNPGPDDESKREREGKAFYEGQGTINVDKLIAVLMGVDPTKVENGLLIPNRWFGQWGTVGNAIARKYEDMTPEQRKNEAEFYDFMLGSLPVDALQDFQEGVFANSSSFLTALFGGPGGFNRWGVNVVNMFANIIHPAAFAQFSRAQLPEYTTQKADTFLKELENSLLTRSSTLRLLADKYPPSKVSIWGEPMKKQGGTIQKLFNITRADKDMFARPLYEDAKKYNDPNFFPPAVTSSLNGIQLTADQTRALQEFVGKARKERVGSYANNESIIEPYNVKYSDLKDPEDKKFVLNYLYELGKEEGVDKFYEQYKELKPKEKPVDYVKDLQRDIFKTLERYKKQ